MKARQLKILGCATLMALILSYAMMAHQFQLPLHELVKAASNYMEVFKQEDESSKISKEYREIPKEYLETDVVKLISIEQEKDVVQLRTELIYLLWGKPGLPSSNHLAVDNNIADTRYEYISSLSRIDKLSIVMEFGIESHVYHFIPKIGNNKVVLYHEGHDGDFYTSKVQIKRFLDNGYSVVAFAMPLLGLNNQPTVQISRQGKLRLTSHDHMKFLSPKNGHPVKYFVEPVILVLNYLESSFDYFTVSMVGISGGGWTTTLAAAIDTRIDKSFPVAGSYPIYLRENRDWGDFEQTVPEVYNTVNYLELYILGSYGSHRKQLQVINQYDTCCFGGTKWTTYTDIVKKRVRKLGSGEFNLFMDSSHKGHLISEVTMNRILDELRSNSNS